MGDSYDNALAETINGLYKTEVIEHEGPWRGKKDVELATLVCPDICIARTYSGVPKAGAPVFMSTLLVKAP